MDTVKNFMREVGRRAFEEEVGVPAQSVSRAIAENVMPAGWYIHARGLCFRKGIACPEHLFRWAKGVTPSRRPSREASNV